MNIVEKSSDMLTKKEIYDLTRSPKSQKLSDHVGEILPVDQYVIYTDEDTTDNPTIELLSIRSGDLVVVTNSATALREFRGILEIMEGEPFSVEIINGTSKNGRTFITMALA